MNTQKFSFLIISFNRAEDTIDAIKNVLQLENVQGWEKEIIVLNNGSTTDYSIIPAFLQTLTLEENAIIQYIHSNKNLGVSGGRNLLIQKSKGKYLLFMDDDSEIDNKDVIQKVLDLYKKYESERLAIIGFLGQNPFTGKFDMPLKNPTLIEGKNEIFYNLFFGYGHVFPRDLIVETGFYQTDFFYGMEEYDLSYATVKAGYSILFTKEILVIHKQNPNGREPSVVKQARMFENKMIVVYKHLPWLYVMTHFIMWSAFFLYKSKGSILVYFKTILSMLRRMKIARRNVIGASGMQYLKDVQARLWY
ncbi:MAG TPA: glycosyltransferase [Chitinophagales bacterium]|jgi:GT2 family glycosyltransferase|nr:glycosyltransferase [Chitinophagales bacterium]HQW78963.1 glycosyltransferase [Chitinophagales bacterium]HRB67045.1 glycosyltransferase [Chitinophagales bacterium]